MFCTGVVLDNSGLPYVGNPSGMSMAVCMIESMRGAYVDIIMCELDKIEKLDNNSKIYI